jgi:alcohol dehydrogenase
MNAFDFQLRTRIVFGPDRIESLGELAGELRARRVLVVSDPGVVAAGHVARGIASLEKAGIATHLFDGVAENPTDGHVKAGVAAARRSKPELIVGLGGGSSMDCAKGINFVYCCGGRIHDYWGVDQATCPLLPMIGVPTTAGTGSEAQSFALISDSQTHTKMACGDKKAACRVALLDPTLTVSQPRGVTALTGIDAVAHAVETYVTSRRNAVSLAFSREAWQLLAENFPKVLSEPTDLDARGGMQLGACFAGLAIENSMLGATHALANPLTASFGMAHGQAIGLLLPHVIRFNGVEFDGWYRELLEYVPSSNGHGRHTRASDVLADVVADFARQADLPDRLSQCGVERSQLPDLAADAARQWTGSFNPRKVGVEELLALYERAY